MPLDREDILCLNVKFTNTTGLINVFALGGKRSVSKPLPCQTVILSEPIHISVPFINGKPFK